MIRFELFARCAEHVETIADWLCSEWGDSSPQSVKKLANQLQRRLSEHSLPMPLLTLDEGRPVGFVALKLHEMDTYPEREHWLGSLFVPPPERGRGIGGALIQELVRRGKDHGVSLLMSLQTNVWTGGFTVSKDGRISRLLTQEVIRFLSWNPELIDDDIRGQSALSLFRMKIRIVTLALRLLTETTMTIPQQIHAGQLAGALILKTEDHIAFLDHEPMTKGHALVCPVRPVKSIFDLSAEEREAFFRFAERVEAALRKSLEPLGMTHIMNDGPFNEFGQLHLHLIPRYQNDGFSWAALDCRRHSVAELETQVEKIVRSLRCPDI